MAIRRLVAVYKACLARGCSTMTTTSVSTIARTPVRKAVRTPCGAMLRTLSHSGLRCSGRFRQRHNVFRIHILCPMRRMVAVVLHQHHRHRAHTVRIVPRQRTHIHVQVIPLRAGSVQVAQPRVMVILSPQVAV